MATCSSILAWKIPWSEELGGLQSTGVRTEPSSSYISGECQTPTFPALPEAQVWAFDAFVPVAK